MLPMCLYAGILHSSSNIPWYFVPLDKISMIKYAFQALVINEYGNNDFYDPIISQGVFKRLGLKESDLGRDLGILFALLVGFRLLAYLFLMIRARRALV